MTSSLVEVGEACHDFNQLNRFVNRITVVFCCFFLKPISLGIARPSSDFLPTLTPTTLAVKIGQWI